jgi:hypothetical protein
MTKDDDKRFIRWMPEEWKAVMLVAAPHILSGKLTPVEALLKGQRAALPKSRHRDEKSLQVATYNEAYRRFRDEAVAAIPPEVKALATTKPARRKPEPKPKMDEGRNYSRPGRAVRWTTREKALVARQITKMREAGDERALSRLLIEAQDVVLPEDRRRPVASIQAGVGANNDKTLAEGMQNIWLLEPEAPTAPPTPPAPPDIELNLEPGDTAPPQAEPLVFRTDGVDKTPRLPVALERGFSEAAQAFGNVVMGAFDTMLAKHTDVLLSHVYEKLSAQAAQTGAMIAAMIERGMRDTVHKLVEAELGPVVTHGPTGPAAAPVAPAAPSAPAAPAAPSVAVADTSEGHDNGMMVPGPGFGAEVKPKVRVDVVGFANEPDFVKHVTTAINGSADVRFFNLDRHSYAPHRGNHCIMLALQKVPHAVKAKLRSAGVEPIYVKNSPHQVIHAVEELLRVGP